MPDDHLKDHMFGKVPPTVDPETLSISAMDGKYSTARPTNKEVTRLHVIFKDGKIQTFQYMYLDARSTFEPGKFIITFCGAKHWQLTVESRGKRFWDIYDYCTLKRWPYLREAVRDFDDENETVFTSISVVDVTPKD